MGGCSSRRSRAAGFCAARTRPAISGATGRASCVSRTSDRVLPRFDALAGQLGAGMPESAQAGRRMCAHAHLHGELRPTSSTSTICTCMFPRGPYPRTDRAQGATMAAALASLLTGHPCRREVAVTGEITLRGRILAVGGVREKLLAAARAGVTTVCIPQANARELVELPASLQRKLEIIPISTLDDLFAHALVGGAPAARVAVATAG